MRHMAKENYLLGMALLIGGVLFAQQEFFIAEPVEEPRPVFDLPLVSPETAPDVGTFWLHSSTDENGVGAPYPFDPYAGLIPLYSLPGLPGQYLVADTLTDFAQMQAIHLQMAQLESGGGMMSMNSLEFPGEGDTNGTGEGGSWEYTPIVYGSNDLWLELTGVTNGQGAFVLHLPAGAEAFGWDLFATTNLTLDTPPGALNLTNWTWLHRAPAGVTNLTVPLLWWPMAFARLAATNDTDGDSLSDAFEALVSHSNAATNDTDGDGLFDDWSWDHFGHATGSASDHTRAEDDYDSDGVDNWTEQLQGANPNDLRFQVRLPDEFVNQTSVAGTVPVSGGVPYEMAVLVNTTNLAGALWQNYTSNFTAVLGPTDGPYTVRVALRGRAPEFVPVVDQAVVILDRVAPVLAVTNPVSATVIKPYLQLQGWANEPLASLRYNLSNAFGVVSNVPAAVIDQDFDTNAFDFTTNQFQAYDVPLATNLNHLCLSVTDRAGNVSSTNLWLTLDYSDATNPPSAQLQWPTNGLTIAGTNMTVRGQISDETASLSVWWVDGGVTNTWPGIVERNGTFWLDQLPLGAGTNQFNLRAEDAAGNVSESSFEMIKGSLTVAVTSTPGGEGLYAPKGSVSGWVSAADASVSVNGVTAIVDELGNWNAEDVPLQGDGESVFDVTATPPGGAPEQFTHLVEKPAMIRVMKHLVKLTLSTWNTEHTWTKNYRAWDEEGENGQTRHRYTGSASSYWAVSEEGSGLTDYEWSDSNPAGTFHWTHSLYGESSGPMTGSDWPVQSVPDRQFDHSVGLSDIYVEHFHARGVRHEWAEPSGAAVETLEARTQLRLYTGGRSEVGRESLFSIEANVTEYAKPRNWLWFYTPGETAPPERVSINDEPVDLYGRIWRVLADNSKLDVNVKSDASKHFSASHGVTKHRLLINANGTPLREERVGSFAYFNVGEKVDFTHEFDPPLTQPVESLATQWTLPGIFVNGTNQPCVECSVNYTLNADLLTNISTHAWWVSGGTTKPGEDYLAEVSVVVNFVGGATARHQGRGLFRMFRPLPEFTAENRGAIGADTNYRFASTIGGPWLHFGAHWDATNHTDAGVAFAFSNPPLLEKFGTSTNDQTYGSYFITQTMVSDIKRNIGSVCAGERLAVSGLDNIRLNERFYTPDKTSGSWGDSPGTPLGANITWASIEQSFKSVLMFIPASATDEIAVPMYETTWGWSASAKTNNFPDGYQLIQSQITPLSTAPTTSFPHWTNVVGGESYTTNLPCFDEN